jgi:hypothetical protein
MNSSGSLELNPFDAGTEQFGQWDLRDAARI